jgi:hypothetical protein
MAFLIQVCCAHMRFARLTSTLAAEKSAAQAARSDCGTGGSQRYDVPEWPPASVTQKLWRRRRGDAHWMNARSAHAATRANPFESAEKNRRAIFSTIAGERRTH